MSKSMSKSMSMEIHEASIAKAYKDLERENRVLKGACIVGVLAATCLAAYAIFSFIANHYSVFQGTGAMTNSGAIAFLCIGLGGVTAIVLLYLRSRKSLLNRKHSIVVCEDMIKQAKDEGSKLEICKDNLDRHLSSAIQWIHDHKRGLQKFYEVSPWPQPFGGILAGIERCYAAVTEASQQYTADESVENAKQLQKFIDEYGELSEALSSNIRQYKKKA